jgi:response regulator RpfG family c-di-GMP phosphodiesterase
MDFLVHAPPQALAGWKVLLVDDEPEVHEVTRLVLGNFRFEDRPLDILSAMTAEEAKEHLAENGDIAVILLDVVMESDQAGLKLVDYIRNEMGNKNVRIVLRTGQPGQAPEHEVIIKYDINDYKEKTELTSQKLATTLFASLRSYRDIMTIEANKRGLERVIAASAHIFSHEKTAEFASAVLSQLATLIGMDKGALYCKVDSRRAGELGTHILISAATGDYTRFVAKAADETLPPRILETLQAAQQTKTHQFRNDHYVLHFTDSQQTESLLYVGEAWDLSELDYRLVEVFCTNVSIGFENLHLNQELFDSQLEMIFLLAGAAESRSRETAAHVRRVGELAGFLARHYGLDETMSDFLHHAAPLHDIGKIAIPDSILNKPGKHTSEESEVMRTHAEIGHQMLDRSPREVLRLAAEIALSHHENWDGSGYPRGLSGEDIPISGRITMLADVFDALGSDRCYKDAWEWERIREFVIAERGKKFDPKLVDLLLDHWEEAVAIRSDLPD